MLLEIVQQINLLDILIILILVRTVSIAIRKGFAVEFFKLLGTYCATYLALHYFTHLADRLHTLPGFRSAPIEFIDFVAFLFLVIIGYNFILLMRIIVIKSRAQEALRSISRWSGMLLGVVRGGLLAGIICFGFAISSMSFFSDMVSQSLMGNTLFEVPSQVYEWTWNNITKHIAASEQVNKTIAEVRKSVSGQPDEEEDDETAAPEPIIVDHYL